MSEWFWGWLIAAGAIAAVSAVARDRFTAPWAAGCLAAAGLEALNAHVAWQWAAFLLVSGAVSVAVNRAPRYVARHTRKRDTGKPPARA